MTKDMTTLVAKPALDFFFGIYILMTVAL